MFSKKFICASYNYSTYAKAIPAPYFRKSFILYTKPVACSVTICGLGFYDLFVNGRKITKGLLAPYISNPDDLLYYDTYDLAEYLSEGKNVLGIQLGNGMQNAPGGQIWDFDKAAFRGAPRVAFAIEIENEDGSRDVIEANRTVKTAPSPILFDDLRCGCFYDARNEIPDWAQIRFVDDSWDDALPAETPRGEARLTEAEPILPLRHVRAVSHRPCTLAEYSARDDVPHETNGLPLKTREGVLYDFGINCAGIERLKIRGERGQQIDLQFLEYLNTDGNPDYSNICFYPDGFSQRDIYICKGEGEEIFEPSFTYHGYRYCVVLGLRPDQATDDLVTMKVASSALKERGSFTCSDDTANRLQAMTRNSTLSNFYYFPTDCPHREKNGWTGDAQISAEHASLNLATEKSYREWLRSIVASQDKRGALPGIVPTGGWGFHWGNGPGWDAVLTELPYVVWRLRGDTAIVKENAHAIFSYLQYIASHRTARGTVELGLGDWCAVTQVKSPLEFTDSVITLNILKKAATLFGAIGCTAEKVYADTLYGEIRASVRKYLIDFSTMTAIGDCQTSQSMAIYYDVFEPGEKPEAFRVLLSILARTENHIDFGIFGARVLFRVLSDFGESDLAYEMITRKDFPSYGNFVARGLTALPEDFLPDGARPNSLNHHFFGDISAWFIEYVAGLRVNPYETDPAEILWKPAFIGKLTHAAAFYDTVKGKVSVRWERTNTGLRLTAEVPDGVSGEIRLPEGYCFTDTETAYRALKAGTCLCQRSDAAPELDETIAEI